MAKGDCSHNEIAHARNSDGINVIFDQDSPASSRGRSRGSCSSRSRSSSRSSVSGRSRARGGHRRRYRSRSSSASPSSPRSRSHPRCHRRSSRCRCDGHHKYARSSRARSPRSDRHPRRKHHTSRSKTTSHSSRHRRTGNRPGSRPSPTESHRSRSRSRSSVHSLIVDDKRELISAAKANAMKILEVENLELPESIKPILPEQSQCRQVSPEPGRWVRQYPEDTLSQNDEVDQDDFTNPRMSPKRKIISFSINNSVAKPTAAALSSANVTPRVDSYESRRPYGHWVPVRLAKSSKALKHTH